MSIKYVLKTHDLTINDKVNRYYSDATLDAALASGEKFFLSVRASAVTGSTPTLTLGIDLSNDGIDWITRSTPLSAAAIAVGGVTILSASELGASTVGGRFMRTFVALADTGSVGAHIEVWVCGRSAG